MNLSEEAQASEGNLIQLARQGDEAAWESLVRDHQEAIFRLAYLFLYDGDEAQDVAQEVFLRAYHHLDGFDASRPLRPWLLSITANLARNRRRSLGRYWAALTRWFNTQPPADSGVEALSGSRLQSQSLWKAIRQLGQPDQEIIYLRYFLELSVSETAETYHVAEGTVKSRLHRALAKLREVIEREHPDLREFRDE
jgi:RNA polymerase sigma-70 factor (ECF subfamily)